MAANAVEGRDFPGGLAEDEPVEPVSPRLSLPNPMISEIAPVFTGWASLNLENYREVTGSPVPAAEVPRVLYTRTRRRVVDFVLEHHLGSGSRLQEIIMQGIAVNTDSVLIQPNPDIAVNAEELEALLAVMELCRAYEESEKQENARDWASYSRQAARNIQVGSFLSSAAAEARRRNDAELQALRERFFGHSYYRRP